MRIALTVNGEPREADVWGGESLLYVLRERLGLPGSKNACEQGECGSCSVLLDGELVCACLVLAAQADGHEVVTVEGLARRTSAAPACRRRSSRRARCSAGSARPGSSSPPPTCSSATPDPTDDEIREALSGNLCRCTGYAKIFDAVRLAADARDERPPSARARRLERRRGRRARSSRARRASRR